MSVILEAAGYKVKNSDISSEGCYGTGDVDFFSVTKSRATQNVITNPPYRWARQFIDHALTLVSPRSGKVAMLLQLHFLGSVSRHEWFRETGLSRVYTFSRTLPYYDFKRGIWHKTSGFAHAWFVWDMAAVRKDYYELHPIPPGPPHNEECWDFKTLEARKKA